jgi:hypothetical protein
VDGLTVRIAPTWHFINEPYDIRHISGHFYVLVSNQSDEPLRIWAERTPNSWSWNAVSFLVTSPGGTTIHIERADHGGWYGNVSQPYALARGDTYVRDVNLFDGTWTANGESLDGATWLKLAKTDAQHRFVQMHAIYSTPPDVESQRRKVWTGKLTSPQEAYEVD